jgi:hypothetical protein
VTQGEQIAGAAENAVRPGRLHRRALLCVVPSEFRGCSETVRGKRPAEPDSITKPDARANYEARLQVSAGSARDPSYRNCPSRGIVLFEILASLSALKQANASHPVGTAGIDSPLPLPVFTAGNFKRRHDCRRSIVSPGHRDMVNLTGSARRSAR